MRPPKYKFYIGPFKYDFATRQGYIDLSGSFIADQNYRSSNLTAVPKSRLVYIMNAPQKPDARISYYDADNSYLGYDVIKQGFNAINNIEARYYAVTYNNTDKAFTNNYFLADLVQVTPHYKELKKKYAKESGQQFFRQTLDGKITIFGRDMELVYNASIETPFIFTIEKYTDKSVALYFKAKFSKSDCSFDFTKKSCELKLTALDDYTNIMNKYDNTYDLVKLAPALTQIHMYKRPIMQVYVAGASSISNFFGGTYWETDVNSAVDNDGDLVNKYYFAYVSSGNEFIVSGASVSGANGQYAGTSGIWTNESGYTCEAYDIIGIGEGSAPTNISFFRVRLKNSSGTILYNTGLTFQVASGSTHQPALTEDEVTLYRVNSDGTVSTTDTCKISMTIVYNIYQRLLCDTDNINGTATYDLPVDDFAVSDRNYKKCIGLQGGYFFCTARTTSEPTKYGQNDYGEYFTNQFIPASTGLGRPLPISRNSWANASLWYVYSTLYEIWEADLRKEYVLKDSYSIGAAIKALLNEIDPSLMHEETSEYSQFLYGSSSPIGLTKFSVFITQKTNILKNQYDQAAQKAEISFEELMNMLRDCFRCYWFIEDSKFKVEHISYFINGGSYSTNTDIQLDFTELTDQFNKKLTSYGQGQIEYNKDDLTSRYEFSWMDDVTDLFGNFNVDVKSNYIQEDKTEEITVNQFTPDVDLMTLIPSNFSEDGFALLCAVKNGYSYTLPIVSVYLKDENGDTYNTTVQNWYASWLYLINTYMYDMPAFNIEYNSLTSGLYVHSIKRCMSYAIEFPSEEDPNERSLIKTALGDGIIDEMSINIDTRLAAVDLVYEPN